MNHEHSHRLFETAQQLFPGGVNSPVRACRSVGCEPFIVERGEGPYLIDVDGNRYVDYICSWGPLVLGHAHPAVVDAIARQAACGTSYGACSELESLLALKVRELFPHLEMMRFVNSGTEAGMSVLRLARGYTSRSKVLKFSGCYHGHSDSFLVSAGSGVATLGLPDSPGVLAEVARDTITVPFNDIDAVKQAHEAHSNAIAAVIVEPVVGNAGLIAPNPGFLEGLREITTRYGSLLIFDEVMSGFRVDLGGAARRFGVTPDLTMLGKVIGGGLPVGAFGGRREIMQQLAPLGPIYQAGTLSGNPLAMRAGLTNLDIWSRPGCFERAAEVASQLTAHITEQAARCAIPLCAHAVGTMFGFFFTAGPVHNYEQAKRSDTARFATFFRLMLERGVFFAPSQFEAGFVSVAHEGEALQHTCAALSEVFPLLTQG